jgi:hypothetical protein
MTDPIQRNSSVLDWIKGNRLESVRRVIAWGALVAVLLYIYGEMTGSEEITIVGIWALVGVIAAAIAYKAVDLLLTFFS